MKKSEQRELEKELRLLAREELQLDPEHDAQMTAWVKAQYEQAIAAKANEAVHEKKIGRRILIVAATAVLLMVFSFVYTIFTPDAVSHAKGFVHRATIWVNDTFHLGLVIEVPSDDTMQGSQGDIVYDSLEEAAANLPYPLVYLKHPDVELQSITVMHAFQIPKAVISYRYESSDFDISLSYIGEEYSAGLNDFDGEPIPWEEGQLAYWDLGTCWFAVTYYAGFEISINSDVSFDTFANLCKSLASLN